MSNIKNKKYEVPLEIQLDLYTILNIFDDEAHNCPEEFAKFMIELGHDGDWTLEHDYLKLLKLEKNVAEATGIDSYAITESFKQAMENNL